MTHTHAEFVAAICAAPAEDTPRLVYADWLDDEGLADRAAFIRAQVGLSHKPGHNHTGHRCTRACPIGRLWDAEFAAVAGKPGRWFPPLHDEWAWHWGINAPAPARGYLIRRGFACEVGCTAEDWLAHADQIYWHPGQRGECPETAQPLERVVLTSTPRLKDIVAYGETVEAVDRALGMVGRDIAESLLKYRWPHIEFTLPQGDYPLPAEEQDPAVIP